MKISMLSLLVAVSLNSAGGAMAAEPSPTLAVLHRVADWQLTQPQSWLWVDWRQAVGCVGFMALSELPGGERYEKAMVEVGTTVGWKLAPKCRFHADDQVVGQMYLALYAHQHRPEMIADTVTVMDEFCARPDAIGGMSMSEASRRWTWCDALFMAPPVLARLYATTGDKRYLDALRRDYSQTVQALYDRQEHLFARDETYVGRREANGQRIFWSRGNGWVLAGLALILDALPEQADGRAEFVTLYQELARRIMPLQQADGLWRASLLDPASYPLKESSGTALYVYALAWGIRHGLLDRAGTMPVVTRAWAALQDCVAADGRLTHVQPMGKDPRSFPDDSTDIFGVGTFLLAGSAVYRLDTASP